MRRLAVLLFAVTAIFFALRILPGDAITAQLIESGVSQQTITTRISQLGFDDPIFVQYVNYLLGTLRGEWGYSLSSGLPVFEIVLPSMVQTLIITTSSAIFATFLGIGLGLASIFRVKTVAFTAKLAIFISLSIPVFVTSVLLLVAMGSLNDKFYVLPILVLTFHGAGAIGRVTYTALNEQMKQDYVRTALSKGLTHREVLVHHIIPASITPIIAVVALQFSFLISGTVIVETIFGINGIGRLIYNSTLRRDYFVVQGAVVVVAISITLTNTIADLLYRVFDPRLRLQ